MDIQGALWDRARENGEPLDKVVTGTRNYAHFERVNLILQELHTLRHKGDSAADLPTRMQGSCSHNPRIRMPPPCLSSPIFTSCALLVFCLLVCVLCSGSDRVWGYTTQLRGWCFEC